VNQLKLIKQLSRFYSLKPILISIIQKISVGSDVPDYENDATTQTITVTCYQTSGVDVAHTVVVNIANVDEGN